MKKILLLLCSLFCHEILSAQINTIAGTGISGYNGDTIVATNAQMKFPFGLVRDKKGNIYYSDVDDNRVRKIDANGIVTTVAGTGVAGFSGDGGQGNLAQLNAPKGLAVDKYNNLYVADYSNYRVRKIDTNGVISTFAGNGSWGYLGSGDGGQAIAAAIREPRLLAFDSSGTLFMLEYTGSYGGCLIRKIATNGIISSWQTFNNNSIGWLGQQMSFDKAGNLHLVSLTSTILKLYPNGYLTAIGTQFGLSAISGVAFDGANNMYLSDTAINKIYKIDSTGLVVTPVAGNGIAGYGGDGGPANSANLNYPAALALVSNNSCVFVYVNDQKNYRIRKVELVTYPTITIFAAQQSVISGDSAVFNSSAANGGLNSVHQWKVNGVNMGGNTSVFSYVPSDGDTVYCTYNNFDCYQLIDTSNKIVVHVTPNSVTGLAGSNGVQLYPNPSSGTFTISGKWFTANDKNVAIDVVDAVGQNVHHEEVAVGGSKMDYTVHLSEALPAGIYVLKISGERSLCQRLVIGCL